MGESGSRGPSERRECGRPEGRPVKMGRDGWDRVVRCDCSGLSGRGLSGGGRDGRDVGRLGVSEWGMRGDGTDVLWCVRCGPGL
jgi:hypothetical protein